MLSKEWYEIKIYNFRAYLGQILPKNEFFSPDFLKIFTKTGKKQVMFFRPFWGKKYISKEPSLWFRTMQLRKCTVGQPMKFWKKGFLRLFYFWSKNWLVKHFSRPWRFLIWSLKWNKQEVCIFFSFEDIKFWNLLKIRGKFKFWYNRIQNYTEGSLICPNIRICQKSPQIFF